MIVYKIDILAELKKKGYNSVILREMRPFSQSAMQNMRTGKYISFDNLDKVCELLELQPGDIIEYRERMNS